MIKIIVDGKNIEIGANGTAPDLMSELFAGLAAMREKFPDDTKGFFDSSLMSGAYVLSGDSKAEQFSRAIEIMSMLMRGEEDE